MPDHPDPDATGAYQAATPDPPPAERFAPGSRLAARYRVVAPLGRGGMGEVYRADDLTLGQPVALKFLPTHVANDPDRLARFRKEVAAARQVSHPHVCRVYDIAEHEGQSFLTMEFVDGEDLSSVLKRLGRMTEEKGIEIARQLCGAVAAVHDRGLLHRDLKPANVMLDGRGRVRLTDFGLAAAAEDLSATEVRSGTPLYQAPEQLAGREVTVRSDLFSLGLVLYELFTGKRAFADAGRGTPPSRPSSHVSNLTPAVERVILRCLEADPAHRPRSAFEVLAGLPGGDPLAAALAAGETPSPQLVADAGGEGEIRPWVGLALLGVVAAGIALAALLADRVMLFHKVPLPDPPEVMARRAKLILERCVQADPPADSAYHFRVDEDILRHTQREDPSPDRWDNLGTMRPGPLYFFYRQSPGSLAPTDADTGGYTALVVTDDNPPPTAAGMAGVHLDPNGRLLRLYAVPPRQSAGPETPADPDWGRWFDPSTIGFDLKTLKEVRSERTPPCPCDRQAAWVGALPDRPDRPVRVEAAAYRGHPVYFEVMPAWREAGHRGERPQGMQVVGPLALLLLGGAVVLAIRNLRRGRADVRGAVRLGGAILAIRIGAWLIGGHHTPSGEWAQFVVCVGEEGSFTLLYGLGYLAVEPAVRRRWPWQIIAWSRLLEGRLRYPMVGRDLLIGLALGAAVLFATRAAWSAAHWAGVPPPPPLIGTGPTPLQIPGPPPPLLVLLMFLSIPIMVPMLFLLNSPAVFLVLRRQWLAWGAVWLFNTLVFALPLLGPSPLGNGLILVGWGLRLALVTYVVARFGLLVGVGWFFCHEMLSTVPLTADLSAWFAPQGVVMALVVIGLAGYAFVTATGGAKLFKEGFFGDD